MEGGYLYIYIFLFYFFGALPFIIKDNCFQFFTSTVWTQFFLLPVELLSILRCSATFLLLLLCSRCTAAANAADAAVGDNQLLPSPAAGCLFRCSAARGCHDRASAPAAATLAAAATAGFWAGLELELGLEPAPAPLALANH